jgi:hypothetical protein
MRPPLRGTDAFSGGATSLETSILAIRAFQAPPARSFHTAERTASSLEVGVLGRGVDPNVVRRKASKARSDGLVLDGVLDSLTDETCVDVQKTVVRRVSKQEGV